MYRFPLQRVLELRALAEERRAVALAAAQAEASGALHACHLLEAARTAEVERLDALQRTGATVGELLGLRHALDRAERGVEGARGEVQRAEEQVAACRSELQTASQERRVLERLRERGAESWTQELARTDTRTMDAIALARFTRDRSRAE